MIRIGFWGPFYYNYNQEPPKQYWCLFRPLDCFGWNYLLGLHACSGVGFEAFRYRTVNAELEKRTVLSMGVNDSGIWGSELALGAEPDGEGFNSRSGSCSCGIENYQHQTRQHSCVPASLTRVYSSLADRQTLPAFSQLHAQCWQEIYEAV